MTEGLRQRTSEGIFDSHHRSLTVGVLLAILAVAFEGLALTTVAPAIARDLGGVGLYGWIFSAFLLPQLVATVVAGSQADRRGLGPPFAASLALFAAGLLVGAAAPNMPVLILGRALQGLGAGALGTCVYAAINKAYPDRLRPRMLAVVSTAYITPALVGPALAGFVAERLDWRAIFWGLLPLLAVVAALALPAFGRLDRGEPEGGRPGRLPNALLLALGTGLLLAGLGARLLFVAVPMAAAGLAVAVFALRRLLPAGTLMARRGLPALVAARGLFVAAFLSTEVYLVLALADLSGYGVAVAGLAVSAGALSWSAGSFLQARLDARDGGLGRRSRVVAGVAVMVGAVSALAALVAAGSPPLVPAITLWVSAGLGMGLAHATSGAVAFALAPESGEGAVSSSLLLADLFGPAVSIGVGGTLVSFGGASQGGLGLGVALALGIGPPLLVLALVSALRLPRQTEP